MLTAFGTTLKQAREVAGLAQTEFAKLVGVSFSSINRYENGHLDPTLTVLNAIKALLLNTSQRTNHFS